MPVTPWAEWSVLADRGGPLGFVLWRSAADVLLWCEADPAERRALFGVALFHEPDLVAFAIRQAPDLREAIQTLWTVHTLPELADADAASDACYRVSRWAESQGIIRTAAQFAELAARLQPESAPRAFTAGRLCRRAGEVQRAAIWYSRSNRLARRAGSNIDRANAHLGLGNLEYDLGHHARAEQHFLKAARAALRNGRKSLAGAAHHNLVGVAYETGRVEEALQHLGIASEYYGADHPRFPVLAYDAGFFLLREGYFSSALLVFESVLPWLVGQRVEILARSALARSAAAVRDHIRYQRAAEAVLALAAMDDEGSANALYQLAEGARSFLYWERAEELAKRAFEVGRKRQDGITIQSAAALLRAISGKEPGDVDRVPPVGDPVDRVTQEIMRKLKKRPAPASGTGTVPPEDYPTD